MEAVAHPIWHDTATLGRRIHSWLDEHRLFFFEDDERLLLDAVGWTLKLTTEYSGLSVCRLTTSLGPTVRSVFCMPTCTEDTPGDTTGFFPVQQSFSAEDIRQAVCVAVELGWFFPPPFSVTVEEHWASEWNL